MAATPSLEATLRRYGFGPLGRWTRGVDLDLFHPDLPPPPDLPDLPRPIFAYVGRLAAEKNIDDFLSADLPGSKLLVGDGPDRAALTARWPQAHFTGSRSGADLAAHYAAADVLVFPSRTDTFGLVMLEALACGTPVAAYPVTGPLDIFSGSAGRKGGVLSDTLAIAARRALALNPADCRRLAENFSWAAATRQFLSQLTPIDAEHTRSVGTALAERLYS
jgi:glycosyltransferase involved in cell wall biosynthesis